MSHAYSAYYCFMCTTNLILMLSNILVYNYYMDTRAWFNTLIKPDWAPPGWLFGPVWTVLYIMIFISFGRVFQLLWSKQISFAIALPFILNIFFNLIFTTLQFGLKNNYLASIDILLILSTLIWAMVVIFPVSKFIFYMQIPYVLWVSFATVLQLTITYLNR